jgi:hypothetical protein
MMTKQSDLIHGQAAHRRTESDYMSILLDSVTLEDWREVVSNALAAAKAGDAKARVWLATFLMGAPRHKAPTPLTVVVGQWTGRDPVVEQLADPIITRAQYPFLQKEEALKERIRARVAEELAYKLPASDAGEALALTWDVSEMSS